MNAGAADRQRAHIVLGQKCLETREQRVIGQPLDRQRSGAAAAGNRSPAGGQQLGFCPGDTPLVTTPNPNGLGFSVQPPPHRATSPKAVPPPVRYFVQRLHLCYVEYRESSCYATHLTRRIV